MEKTYENISQGVYQAFLTDLGDYCIFKLLKEIIIYYINK